MGVQELLVLCGCARVRAHDHLHIWKIFTLVFVSLPSFVSLEGFQEQQGMTGSGARHVNPTARRPPRPAAVPQSDEAPQNKQQKPRVPVLEKHLISQLSSDEQNSINSKFQEAAEADKKVPVPSSFLASILLLCHKFCIFVGILGGAWSWICC